MEPQGLDTLIQGIYDAALEPDRWAEVARLFGELFASPGGGLFTQDCSTHSFRPISMFGLPNAYLVSYSEYYSTTNAWMRAGLQRPGWTITDRSVDRALNRSGAFAESEFCNDWLKPQGYAYGMGGTVKAVGTEYFHYTILRPPDAPRYGEWEINAFEVLKHHLGRAVETNIRLEGLQQRIRSHSDLLDRVPVGVVLVGHDGQVRHANRSAAETTCKGSLLRVQQNRLVSEWPHANARLQEALGNALAFCRGRAAHTAFAAALYPPGGTHGLSVVAVPLSRAKPLFSDLSLALAVFINATGEPAPLDSERLQARLDLTASEARLMVELARGQQLKAAARSAGLTHETARSYLKVIFRKTETRSQPELVGRLLSDAALVIG